MTLPASGSETTIMRFEQTENSRRSFSSNASPDGSMHGASEYFLVIVAFAASISTISLVDSMFA